MSHHPKRPDPVSEALAELLKSGGLGQGLADLASLNRAWSQAAGSHWRGNSWVLGWHGSELEVGVASPAAATRLRFEAAAIAGRLRQAGLPSVKGIKPRVQPQTERHQATRHRRYSEQAAATVADSAAEVADPGLRAALERLAAHLGEPPPE